MLVNNPLLQHALASGHVPTAGHSDRRQPDLRGCTEGLYARFYGGGARTQGHLGYRACFVVSPLAQLCTDVAFRGGGSGEFNRRANLDSTYWSSMYRNVRDPIMLHWACGNGHDIVDAGD